MLSKPAELSQVWLTNPALQQWLILCQRHNCRALLVDMTFRHHRKDATRTSVQVLALYRVGHTTRYGHKAAK